MAVGKTVHAGLVDTRNARSRNTDGTYQYFPNNDLLYGPYATTAEAYAALSEKTTAGADALVKGKTVGIITNGTIVEYWFDKEPADATAGYQESDLVPKSLSFADDFIAALFNGEISYDTDDTDDTEKIPVDISYSFSTTTGSVGTNTYTFKVDDAIAEKTPVAYVRKWVSEAGTEIELETPVTIYIGDYDNYEGEYVLGNDIISKIYIKFAPGYKLGTIDASATNKVEVLS